MGKAVGGGDQPGGTVLRRHLPRDLGGKIALQRRDAALIRDLRYISRLDTENAMSTALKIGNERSVIGADVDDQVVTAERQHLRCFHVQLGEVVPQELGHATGVWVLRRKDDDRIDRKAELNQLTFPAVKQRGRKPRQLSRNIADRGHLVHGRHVPEREHSLEPFVAANLAACDGNARPTPRRARYCCWKHSNSPTGPRSRKATGFSEHITACNDHLEQARAANSTGQAVDARLSFAQYQSMVGGRPCAKATCGA